MPSAQQLEKKSEADWQGEFIITSFYHICKSKSRNGNDSINALNFNDNLIKTQNTICPWKNEKSYFQSIHFEEWPLITVPQTEQDKDKNQIQSSFNTN